MISCKSNSEAVEPIPTSPIPLTNAKIPVALKVTSFGVVIKFTSAFAPTPFPPVILLQELQHSRIQDLIL